MIPTGQVKVRKTTTTNNKVAKKKTSKKVRPGRQRAKSSSYAPRTVHKMLMYRVLRAS